jgi:hypothetical protein
MHDADKAYLKTAAAECVREGATLRSVLEELHLLDDVTKAVQTGLCVLRKTHWVLSLSGSQCCGKCESGRLSRWENFRLRLCWQQQHEQKTKRQQHPTPRRLNHRERESFRLRRSLEWCFVRRPRIKRRKGGFFAAGVRGREASESWSGSAAAGWAG